MDEDQELRFVCKLCFKKYPCGKSLGGHMRSHVVSTNSAESDEKLDSNMKRYSTLVGGGDGDGDGDGDCDGGGGGMQGDLGNGQSSYGLRENPRKSWRAVDSSFPLQQEKICKQCGKGFHSLKALCGHMACHSDKERSLKDDHSWTSENNNQKLMMDSHSDTEAKDRVVRTRSSKSKRLKKIVIKSPFSLANNGSSSASEIDGEEHEELAMCLMMLSRDTKGGLNSVMESSDNISVILETKSSSIDTRPRKRDAVKTAHDQDEAPKLKEIGDVKSKGCAFDAEIAEMESSDSGYFLDECAKAESDVSVGFRRHENEHDYHGGIASNSARTRTRTDPSRKRRFISEHYNEFDRIKPSDPPDNQKRPKYECFNCKKSFKSYQALGGHRPCHKKSNAYHESRCGSGENSLDDSTEFVPRGKQHSISKKPSYKNSPDKTLKANKKNKGHVCPFCSRVFKNGQALGGHKRSHFIGGHEVNNNPSPASKLDLLDLNLPAPRDDGDGHCSPW